MARDSAYKKFIRRIKKKAGQKPEPSPSAPPPQPSKPDTPYQKFVKKIKGVKEEKPVKEVKVEPQKRELTLREKMLLRLLPATGKRIEAGRTQIYITEPTGDVYTAGRFTPSLVEGRAPPGMVSTGQRVRYYRIEREPAPSRGFVGVVEERPQMAGAYVEPQEPKDPSLFIKMRTGFESTVAKRAREYKTFGRYVRQEKELGRPETVAFRTARAAATVGQFALGGVQLAGRVVFRPVETAKGIGTMVVSTAGTVGALRQTVSRPWMVQRNIATVKAVSKPTTDVGKEIAIGLVDEPILTAGALAATPLVFRGLAKGAGLVGKGTMALARRGQFAIPKSQIGGKFMGKDYLIGYQKKVVTKGGKVTKVFETKPAQAAGQQKLYFEGRPHDIGRRIVRPTIGTERQLTYKGTGVKEYQLHLKRQEPLTGYMLPRRIPPTPKTKTTIPRMEQTQVTDIFITKQFLYDVRPSTWPRYARPGIGTAFVKMLKSKRGEIYGTRFTTGQRTSVTGGTIFKQPSLKTARPAVDYVIKPQPTFAYTESALGLGAFIRDKDTVTPDYQFRVRQRPDTKVRPVPIIRIREETRIRPTQFIEPKPAITPDTAVDVKPAQIQRDKVREVPITLPRFDRPTVPGGRGRPRPPTTPPPKKPPTTKLDFEGSEWRRRRKKKKRQPLFRPFQYTASIVPGQFNIKGVKPKILTGVGRRPLI